VIAKIFFPEQNQSNTGQPVILERIRKSSRSPIVKKENASIQAHPPSSLINYILSMSTIQERSPYISGPKSS